VALVSCTGLEWHETRPDKTDEATKRRPLNLYAAFFIIEM
jgi:hypothetical protein